MADSAKEPMLGSPDGQPLQAYTRALSRSPRRSATRRAEASAAAPPLLNGCRQALSLSLLPLAAFSLAVESGLLALGALLRRLRRGRLTVKNVSLAEGGSATAVITLLARAVAAKCGFGPDNCAPALARHASLVPGSFFGWLATQLLWRRTVLEYRLSSRILTESVNGYGVWPGPVSLLQARTCWFDDATEQFAADRAGAPWQLVVLGAGYDTRCVRLRCAAEATRFEVDAPGTQAHKRATCRKSGVIAEGVRYVSCDFAKESWLERLEGCGFDRAVPAVFIWEGVTMYLPQPAIEATLQDFKSCAPGSMICFDYLDQRLLSNAVTMRMMELLAEPFRFGLGADSVAPFIEAQRLRLVEHLRLPEAADRYMPRSPGGRLLCRMKDVGGLVAVGN